MERQDGSHLLIKLYSFQPPYTVRASVPKETKRRHEKKDVLPLPITFILYMAPPERHSTNASTYKFIYIYIFFFRDPDQLESAEICISFTTRRKSGWSELLKKTIQIYISRHTLNATAYFLSGVSPKALIPLLFRRPNRRIESNGRNRK